MFTKAVTVTKAGFFFLLWLKHSLKTSTEERLYAHECIVSFYMAFYALLLKL